MEDKGRQIPSKSTRETTIGHGSDLYLVVVFIAGTLPFKKLALSSTFGLGVQHVECIDGTVFFHLNPFDVAFVASFKVAQQAAWLCILNENPKFQVSSR